MSKVTVVLPLPSAKLTAQQGGDRYTKADAIKRARTDAGYAAMAAINQQAGEWDHPKEYVFGKANITYRFFLKNNRGLPDESNLIQTCKAYVDGCKDAKLIAEDNYQVLHIAGVSVAIDPKNPRVELIFGRAEHCPSPLEILEAKWKEMQPGRYLTTIEHEEDAAWMNGFQFAVDYLKEHLQ